MPLETTGLSVLGAGTGAYVPEPPVVLGVTTPGGPLLGTGTIGNEHINSLNPILFSKVGGVPVDLPVGSGPSVHSLGPAAGQSAPGPVTLPRRQVGAYHTPIGAAAANFSVAATSSIAYYWPLIVERPMQIGNLGLNVATAATTGSAVISVYPDDGQGRMGGNAVFSSGAVSLTATGGQTGSGSVVLGPGHYFLRVGFSVTTGTAIVTAAIPLFGVTPGGTIASSGVTQLFFDLAGIAPPAYASGGVPSRGGMPVSGGTPIPFFQILEMV